MVEVRRAVPLAGTTECPENKRAKMAVAWKHAVAEKTVQVPTHCTAVHEHLAVEALAGTLACTACALPIASGTAHCMQSRKVKRKAVCHHHIPPWGLAGVCGVTW